MVNITFYPVGNGDTSQIVLDNEKRLLFDFRHISKSVDPKCPFIDLEKRLKKELKDAKKDYFDVVAFTHADSDHIQGSTDFFEFLHASKYQSEDRIKIKELWVPAAMILETTSIDNQSAEFVLLRQEARYRLKEGKGIRVFSKPDKLKNWLNDNGLTVNERRHLITDAGSLVPNFSLANDGIEFFCHSPFIEHVDGQEDIIRNPASLIFNVRFQSGNKKFDYLAVGDSEWDHLEKIVTTTQFHGNEDRLKWDLFNIPHHCSYLALSDEKGEYETIPKPKVKELLKLGKVGANIIISSKPIYDTKDGREQVQPPHIQAKKCYEKYLSEIWGGKIFVTMEEPNKTEPQPIIFNVTNQGIIHQPPQKSINIIVNSPAPRAG